MTARRPVYPFLIAAALLVFASISWAESQIASVGKEKISDADMLFMISSNVGDNGDGMRTALALVQMGDKARLDLVNQLVDELLFATAAREKKLHMDAETARMLRWQEIRTLAGLYLADVSQTWDTGTTAVKKYFDEHPEEFVQAEAVKIKYLMLPTSYDNAILMDIERGEPFQSVAGKYYLTTEPGGFEPSAWMEKGLVKPEFAGAFFSSKQIGRLSPLQIEDVVYIVEITERREPRQLSWEEAQAEASQRLQRYLLKQEVERLKKTHPVKIDNNALSDLVRENSRGN